MKLSERMVSEYLRSNTANPEWVDAAILLEAVAEAAEGCKKLWDEGDTAEMDTWHDRWYAALDRQTIALAALDAVRNTEA